MGTEHLWGQSYPLDFIMEGQGIRCFVSRLSETLDPDAAVLLLTSQNGYRFNTVESEPTDVMFEMFEHWK